MKRRFNQIYDSIAYYIVLRSMYYTLFKMHKLCDIFDRLVDLNSNLRIIVVDSLLSTHQNNTQLLK